MVAVLAEKSSEGVMLLGASAISEVACVPKPTALKILRILKDKGLLRSVPGASGGYSLARKPRDISFLDVIEALEGKLEISRCLCEDYDCSRNGKNHTICRFHRIFKKTNLLICKEFANINFGQK